MQRSGYVAIQDDDDIYSGYDDHSEALDVGGLAGDQGFQAALRTAHGSRPAGLKTAAGPAAPARLPTAAAAFTGRMPTAAGGRLATAAVRAAENNSGERRPMTAIKGTGFSSSRQNADPVLQAAAVAPPLQRVTDLSPEARLRALEEKIHRFMEESAVALQNKDLQLALQKAKDSEVHERDLAKQRESLSGADQINFELTYAVHVNLANVYQRCNMHTEAINTISTLVKNKTFDRAGRLRVNIGNIYYAQSKYLQAVKQYRMALDQIPNTQQTMRNRTMSNIGHCFVKLGQFADAAKAYQHILEQTPVRELDGMEHKEPSSDFGAAFNCLLCHYALGDRDRLRTDFLRMLQMRLPVMDEDRYLNLHNDATLQLYLDAVKNDKLHQQELHDKRQADKYILLAAKLISPVIENSFAEGCDWCVENIKSSAFHYLASELEIAKALTFLKLKEFSRAVQVLKAFEKMESNMLSTAATNLSFLYFLENELDQAQHYADVALSADRYNAKALVNKGNVYLVREQYAPAQELFQEALAIDSGCSEALYNLGLTHRKLGNIDQALAYFMKLRAILPNSPEVLHEIASIHEEIGDVDQAVDWYAMLLSVVPTDPNVLSRLGDIFDRQDDKSKAFQYHTDSFRYFPSNMHTISWFGSYYIESQYVERAINYFELAARVQPAQPKWRLMIASCHRRTGNYQKALDTYKQIHQLFPDNLECLKYLVRICTDMDLPDAQEYAMALKKAEQSNERKESATSSPGTRIASGQRPKSSRRLPQPGLPAAQDRRSGDGSGLLETGRGSTSNRSDDGGRPAPIDASYSDPIGDLPVRPKTAARKADNEEDWGDVEQDLLPD